MPRPARRAVALAAGVALACTGSSARADDDDDGAYGRLAGDLTLAVGVGSALGRGGPSLFAELDARYLDTAGVWLAFADGLGSDERVFDRSLAVGLEASPLFLGRFARGLEQGPATLDLTLDSLAVGVGAFWATPDRSEGPGLELRLGFDVPLIGRASGPWIGARGALRLRGTDLAGRADDGTGAGSYAGLVVAWHQVVGAHLVDAADRKRP